MIRKSILLAGAAALGLLAQPALAQDTPVRGKLAGDFMIGASVIGVVPMNDGGSVDAIGGEPHAGNAVTGQLDFSYFFTPNFAVNLIAATTRHDLEARGTAIGTVDLGHVWALPPTLTFQYHPLPASRFSPYVGVGVNWTAFYSEGGSRSAGVYSVNVDSSFGFALNAGLDIELAPNWLMNLDVKWIYMRPDATVDTALGRVSANAHIDPWVFGVGVRYRF
ncbi:OmpW/AlkL family protein [Neoroseomonas soli]|uniref:OmpW family protein n=1 Tax=Neoroseomonas soli TaxID=1081025 RepID=A0A9X9X0Q4_9PROT|nr:OmpW family outer membrane protein [Neoroseomonas soli]MBR0672983.1 OmpW family protein [Neoroseomonas soli]